MDRLNFHFALLPGLGAHLRNVLTRSAYKKLTVMARTEDQRFTVSESMTIGFIGAGRMAQAMSRGFISKG